MVPDYQIRPLLWRKLRICCTRLDLEDKTKKNEIRIRYDTIQELINIVEIGDGDLFCGLGTLEDCFRMFSYVLFRPLSSPQHIELNALDDEVPFLDPDWEFLELTHEFLLKLVQIHCFRHVIRSPALKSASIVFVLSSPVPSSANTNTSCSRRTFVSVRWSVSASIISTASSVSVER